MKSVITAILLLCSLVSVSQKIAVIEKNNYASTLDGQSKKSYHYFIRELFEKVGGEWEPISNDPYNSSAKAIKSDIFYTIKEANKSYPIHGHRHKSQLNKFLAEDLFRVRNIEHIKLNKLPEFIVKHFEYSDVLETSIISDPSKNKNMHNIKFDTLDELQRNLVSDSIIQRLSKCGYPIHDTSKYFYFSKGSIPTKCKVVDDSIKLCQAYITPQNNCFSINGSAYGGGNLNFLIFPDNKIRLLFANMTLIESGDYDNDGKQEYIFFYSCFNSYGYVMYYDNFDKKKENMWGYH